MFTADADGDLRRSRLAAEAFLPQALGDGFIEAYFRIVHPQMPVLVYTEIIDSWKQMWETPIRGRPVKNQEILFMVLALGARVIRLKKSEQENRADEWAEYFSSRVSEGSIFMQEPSVKGVNLMLLKVRVIQVSLRGIYTDIPGHVLVATHAAERRLFVPWPCYSNCYGLRSPSIPSDLRSRTTFAPVTSYLLDHVCF